MKTQVQPRIIHNHHPCYTLGPLGLYRKGQTVELENGKRVIVLNVEADGAGIAYDAYTLTQWTDELAEKENISRPEAKAKIIEERGRKRTGFHISFLYAGDEDRIQAMMDRQCEVNRERFELASAA